MSNPKFGSAGAETLELPPQGARQTMESSDLAPNTSVGEYVIDEKIGEGAFGTVYQASHPLIGKTVAVKVLNDALSRDASVVSRFISEARAVNKIRHSGIIDIFSFGQLSDGRQYFVMELMEGQPLCDYMMTRGVLGLDDALPILDAVAKALTAAHDAGIAHRDLKPANIFLTTGDDGQLRPKLLDFGIAKLLDEEELKAHKTQTGAALGTPAYMSPEQCYGLNVDHRADIYAFGIMTYEMLTGRLPFLSTSQVGMLTHHVNTPPPPPRSYAPHLSESLSNAILRMLSKRPDDRPQSMAEAMEMLRGEEGQVAAPKASSPLMPSPFAETAAIPNDETGISGHDIQAAGQRRAPMWPFLALLVVSVVAVGAILAFKRAPDPAPVVEPLEMAQPPPVLQKLPEVKHVSIKFTGVPSGTRVLDANGKLLGTAPGSIRMDHGDKEVALSLVAEGFATKIAKVVPNTNQTLMVELLADKPSRPKKRRPKKTKPKTNKGSTKKSPKADDLEPW